MRSTSPVRPARLTPCAHLTPCARLTPCAHLAHLAHLTILAILAILSIVVLSADPAQAQSRRSLDPEAGPRRDPGLEALPEDVRMGLEVSAMLAETIGLHEDEQWQARLATVGYRVAAVVEGRDLPYNFQILDLPEPNAMALPGGFIFVTRGMLESGITDPELAHLIGHEISHVHRDHFERTSRLDTLFSLLQTALMVGILLGGPEYGAERVSVSEDPGDRTWSVGMTGKMALLQGTSIIGSVARALFERGYSRKLEFEADETGNRLAVASGYPSEAGVQLLERLRDRSFEGNRFSYWRTHPYFDERVGRARARAARYASPPPFVNSTPYRQKLALFFATAADQIRSEPQAVYLYRCALQAEPTTLASLPTALRMAEFKRQREQRRHPLERRYGPILAAYDSLIVHALREEPTWDGLAEARRQRRALDQERRDLLPDYIERIDGSEASTGLLERFLLNYPESDRIPEVTYLLGLHHQLSGRPDEAVELLERFLRPPLVDAVPWADSGRAAMAQAVAEVEDLSICQKVYDDAREHGFDALAEGAAARIEELIEADLTLKAGGRYLQHYPDSPWSQRVQERLWSRASQTYEEARVSEGLRRYQEALNDYFAILALAPDSPAAEDADAGIERIHRFESYH